MNVLDRDTLLHVYDDILLKSDLTKDGTSFKAKGVHKQIIVQSTSGSKNKPLLIPRSIKDIEDIAQRVISYYNRALNSKPTKIAMIGGISHIEAAGSLQLRTTSMRHFDLNSYSEIMNWAPDIISCYPSVFRELLSYFKKDLSFLKAVKLGGEKVFPADCELAFDILPNLLIIEQYGLTELPALAIRPITKSTFRAEGSVILTPFDLQTQRFSFLEKYENDWHPVVAKDNFPELLFNINKYYDTGDEALWSSSKIIDFRRRNEIENDYFDSINTLLKEGFVNIQIDLKEKTILHHGINKNNTNRSFIINGQKFHFKKHTLERVKISNKLPILIK